MTRKCSKLGKKLTDSGEILKIAPYSPTRTIIVKQIIAFSIIILLSTCQATWALDFTASGYYDLKGTYLGSSTQITGSNGVNGIAVKEPGQQASDAWFEHEFVISPQMTVNDKLAMTAKIFLAGSPPNNNNNGQSSQDYDDSQRNSYSTYVQYLYLDYHTNIGLFRLGRQSYDIYFDDFLNIDSDGHMLRWYSNDLGKGFKLSGYIAKYGSTGEGSPDATTSDNDYDIYSFGGYLEDQGLTASLWLDYFRDHTGTNSTNKARLKGYYQQLFSSMHAMGEFAYVKGATDYATPGTPDDDIANLAIIGEFGVTMRTVDLSLMAFYASGDDNGNSDHKQTAAMASVYGLGSEFAPLTVLTNSDARLLTGEDTRAANNAMTQAGVIAIGTFSDVAASESLTLHGGVAYAMAEAEKPGWDSSYGWEIDLGLSYKMMDNLSYALDGGYLISGDFFKGVDRAGEKQNVMLVTNVLSMTF